MSRTLLLTGGGGFIGAHTLEHFLANTDLNIFVVDSFKHSGKQERIDQVLKKNELWRDRTYVLQRDLADWNEASTLLQTPGGSFKFDYIINMASESHVDRSISDPMPFVKNNVDLTLHMLEIARRMKPDVFIQISTDEVYGPMINDEPFYEWDRLIPSNPYSASKAAQEMLAISYWRTYDVPVIITNTINNFGEMQDVEKYVPMLIKKILNGETVKIHSNNDELGSRYYLHARNHADALLYMISNIVPAKFQDFAEDEEAMPDKFNIASSVRVDNLAMAKLVAKFVGKPLKYELDNYHETRPGHDMHYGLNPKYLIDEWGWRPPVDFKTSLEQTVANYLENPEWLE